MSIYAEGYVALLYKTARKHTVCLIHLLRLRHGRIGFADLEMVITIPRTKIMEDKQKNLMIKNNKRKPMPNTN